MKKNKVLLNIVLSVLLAIVTESCISFIPNFYKNNIKGYKQTVLTLDDFELVNWSEDGNDGYISLPDPMFIKEGLKTNIGDMDITVDTNDTIYGTTVFFTEKEGETFNSDNIITEGSCENSTLTVKLNRYVNDLRIDPCEAEGIHINNITVILNPDRLSFSFSRFFAVIILYFATAFLFRLQKRPDYTELENNSDGS